jgi:hypothetical protein
MVQTRFQTFSDPDSALNVIYADYERDFENAGGVELEGKRARFKECNALARFACKYGYEYGK